MAFPQSASDWTGGEWTAVVLGALLALGHLALAIFIYVNRAYRPFKALQVNLVLIFAIGANFLHLGVLYGLRIIPQQGAFADCGFWGQWVYMTLGVHNLLAICAFRFFRLYRILIMRKPANTWQFNCTYLAFMAPSVLLAIVCSALNLNERVVEESSGQTICLMHDGLFYSNAILVVSYGVMCLYFAASLHKQRYRIFAEYERNVAFFIVLFLSIILYVVFVLLLLVYEAWGRTFICIYLAIIANSYPWILGSRAIVGYIRDREGYLAYFNQAVHGKVATDDFTRSSNITSNDSTTGTPRLGRLESGVALVSRSDSIAKKPESV